MAALAQLPYWPRLMDDDYSAAYVGLGVTKFLADVGTIWPEPKRLGRRKLWDRNELDASVDALDGESDPFTKALDDG